MVFWGAEVKEEEPYVHRYSRNHGKLHLSQAIIAHAGSFDTTTLLHCQVGSKMPVIVCRLGRKTESCALNLEFEEIEDVTFSVTGYGCSSVHLSGYFVPGSRANPESVRRGEFFSGADPESMRIGKFSSRANPEYMRKAVS